MSSSDANQLNVKDEGGACGDAGLGETAVAHFCGDVDFPAVADVHVLHGDDPTLDKFVQTASQRSGVPTGVKRETIDGAPGVVSSNHTVQCGGLSLAGTGMEHLVVNASGQGFNTFFSGLFFQPARVGESVCQVVFATACTCFSGHDVMVWMVNDFFISNVAPIRGVLRIRLVGCLAYSSWCLEHGLKAKEYNRLCDCTLKFVAETRLERMTSRL